jgi:hypothetical protein
VKLRPAVSDGWSVHMSKLSNRPRHGCQRLENLGPRRKEIRAGSAIAHERNEINAGTQAAATVATTKALLHKVRTSFV